MFRQNIGLNIGQNIQGAYTTAGYLGLCGWEVLWNTGPEPPRPPRSKGSQPMFKAMFGQMFRPNPLLCKQPIESS